MREVNVFNKSASSLPIESLKKKLLIAWNRYFRDGNGFVNIIFVGDRKIKELNKVYLNKNTATDVISFFYSQFPKVSGDVFICVPQAQRQSKGEHSLEKEIFILMLHGFLHVIGYRDYTPKERKRMWSNQNKILKCLRYCQS